MASQISSVSMLCKTDLFERSDPLIELTVLITQNCLVRRDEQDLNDTDMSVVAHNICHELEQ